MTYFSRYTQALIVTICLISVLPFTATAQRANNYNHYTATSSAALYDSSGTTPAQQQMISGWRQSNGLQQKISALPSIANASVLMPVLFGVGVDDISPNFGDPRDNGMRTHQGEDIMAVKGTPIVSPTPAVVLRTETGVDEGNAVYTANPGGETFVYMHLDHFGEGVVSGLVLGQGSLIGYVGNTGNASGGAAHLHLEIHNSAGTPTDPFPRLTSEFTLAQKISYLSTILTQTADPVSLSQFLVINFRSTFTDAIAANIALPLSITNALSSIPASTVPTSGGGSLPAGDLDVGSSGTAVITLQQYLIQAASGPAATRLANAGATGNFQTITEAALVEYQTAVGISPASGYYGATTRAFIAAHPLGTSQPVAVVPSSPGVSGSAVVFSRDLYQGVSGEDVRILQRVLNAQGYAVATSGGGSPGNETAYFGPATLAAVIRFQIAHNITPAAGRVGPLTRAAFAAL